MDSAGMPTPWKVELGEHVLEVARGVVRGLKRGQRQARSVHLHARSLGATDNYAYGSQWNTRIHLFSEDLELLDLPGYDTFRPKGASSALAVINGCVFLPIRHSTSMNDPIGQIRIGSKIPQRLARETGVLPKLALFDVDPVEDADASGAAPTVAQAAAAAEAADLTVVFVAYVANADSDDVLAAWWGTPISLDDDGTMIWQPERLDLTIADDTPVLADNGTDVTEAPAAPGFAQGDAPDIIVTPKPRKDEHPASEPIEPEFPAAAAEDDE